MKNFINFFVATGMAVFVSCSGDLQQDEPKIPDPTPPTPPQSSEKVEIHISPVIDLSRATDYGFEQNDCIGLYVVNYNGTTPGTLKESGNHVDNMRFSYSGTWTPDSQVYWQDETTHADFYLYYPYMAGANVSAMPFEVQQDQSTESAYKASDLLMGKASDVPPSSEAIEITASHIMSRINISIEAGNGFTRESLASANIKVSVNGLQCKSIVNLATTSVTPAGDRVDITPLAKNGSYIALIVPQIVPDGNLITVTVDDREFNLKKGFTFESGKNHTFNVVVNKTSNGVNVNINPWEEDGTDNGGIAE